MAEFLENAITNESIRQRKFGGSVVVLEGEDCFCLFPTDDLKNNFFHYDGSFPLMSCQHFKQVTAYVNNKESLQKKGFLGWFQLSR